MHMGIKPTYTAVRALALAVSVCALTLVAGSASGQDLQSQLEHKKERLGQVKQHEGVLSSEIERYGNRIDDLIGQISVLRNREVIVQDQLQKTQTELRVDRKRLEILRVQLKRSLSELRNRLVDIYRSGEPDLFSVILESDGFDDLVTRAEYLKRVQDQDASLVDRVRGTRDDMRDTVARVTAERDEIADRKAELERTSSELEARQGELDSARSQRQDALARVKDTEQELDGDVSAIQDKIAAQIAAAQEASGVSTTPEGPYQGESSEGFIWPVNGPVVSPFGPRSINGGYENHPGIDISVPTGTPIHASANGSVIFTQSEAESGGYGNYTCIDHGGGISTCYAHQSTFAVSAGQNVSQGQVIGYSDCTGYCFGPHLHFEVRINGQVTDPMAYLP
jgi:murein DD-endopeptidase MepM/ murein hydrolase activator NlpD